ncbi:cache domain-containing protein [Catenovulum maritimum]|uniref:Cache domain-containing protein n=1 Tax=Catenovulum maritimum TaxID=1513271 RepID=A0A0J8JM38_9ALTE|nr:cache domain-containing protein [Catenovulum maritimum]KMT65641.1 hypothetical protein XM47_08065 [Catenovulum maritimum]
MSEFKVANLDEKIPHLVDFKESLFQLNNWWDAASIIARVNQDSLNGQGASLLESMQQTKTRFIELQDRLHECLLKESFLKVQMDISFKSQNVIDVLNRNLFERTADVGFLATDTKISNFVLGEVPKAEIIQHLKQYVAKYSVYDEIFILKLSGEVAANIDQTNKVKKSSDPLIREVKQLKTGYKEYYRFTDLKPNTENSHLFCAPIKEHGGADAATLGILVMSFKLKDEMERIYSTLLSKEDSSVLALLDNHHKVIATSNTQQLQHQASINPQQVLHQLTSQEYIANTSATRGYQGYTGLAWSGLSMLAVNQAFKQSNTKIIKSEEYKLWKDSNLVSNELKQINKDSKSLNRELTVLTLNGKSISYRLKANSFMPILEKLRELGGEMNTVVDKSVAEINSTALSNFKENCIFYSNLAIEIMDRNLYERANDCRWWALNQEFISALQQAELSKDKLRLICAQLGYINDLYTVYTNIFIYDKQGKIITASKPADLPTDSYNVANNTWCTQTLKLQNSQQYAVSDFAQSEFYAGKSTYIYNAAIKNNLGENIGGIGLVFDSEPEFKAMLQDSLPLNEHGQIIESALALFITPEGKVISCSDDTWSPLDTIELPASLTQLAPAESNQELILLDGNYYLAGATASSGYREYKNTNDYVNPLLAVVLIKL